MLYPFMFKALLRISVLALVVSVQAHYNNSHYDYIVVGGGLGGTVVASRLSEDPSISVLLVEAGNFEQYSPNVTNTTVLGIGQGTSLDWQYQSVPQASANNRTITWRAGKGLGGSTLINGMTYMRPASSQIDLWPSLGLELDWDILYNYSRKSEQFQIPSQAQIDVGVGYNGSAHGYTGPLTTSFSQHLSTSDLHNIFNDTMKALNIPPRDEFNGGDLRGFGIQMVTQNATADVREDAARAYYYPISGRPNLSVMVNSTGTRILWSDDIDDLAVASAIEIRRQDGEVITVFADREVILSAGALRSPIILENSGVGNPDILSQQSIETKLELRSVGENMQDQPTMGILAQYAGNETGFLVFVSHVSLHDLLGTNASTFYFATLAKLPDYAALIASHNGGASSAAAQERLLKSQLDLLWASNTPTSEIVPAGLGNLAGAVFWLHQPFSRGSVHINSSNIDAPIIDARFFELDIDVALSIANAKWVRKFMATPPFSNYLNMSASTPSFEMIPENASDEVWLDWIKGTSEPNYHHLGTCAMLPRDLGGVVDNDFKVYGTRNVRVVDLSVVPLQIAGHSMASLYGVSEWAAEKIKSDQ